jgi:hypothetical protein
MVFKIPYDYITKLCRPETEIILNQLIQMHMVMDNEKPGIESIRGLNLVAVRPMNVQLTNCSSE